MILEYTFSSAAVARGASSYLATLMGWDPSALRLQVGPLALDPVALLLVLLLSVVLAKGIKESSQFNIGLLPGPSVCCLGHLPLPLPHSGPTRSLHASPSPSTPTLLPVPPPICLDLPP